MLNLLLQLHRVRLASGVLNLQLQAGFGLHLQLRRVRLASGLLNLQLQVCCLQVSSGSSSLWWCLGFFFDMLIVCQAWGGLF